MSRCRYLIMDKAFFNTVFSFIFVKLKFMADASFKIHDIKKKFDYVKKNRAKTRKTHALLAKGNGESRGMLYVYERAEEMSG